MRHLTISLFVTALIFSCLTLDAAHSQTKPANKIGTASLSGRVTVKGKGMAGIVVALGSSQQRTMGADKRLKPSLKDTTDEDGKYRISNISAGAYAVSPVAPTLVVTNPTESGVQPKELLITEGETVEGFDFALVPGGVITGKVTDTEGRPVIEEPVYIELESPSNIGQSEMQFQQTDDRGVYRAFGIPAGKYRVSAGTQGEGSGLARRGAFRRTYYPTATNAEQATMVEVAEATETTNVDITVVRVEKGVAASGRVVDGKSGEPIPNVGLAITKILVQGTSTSYNTTSTQPTNMRGEFRAEALVPGRYMVTLREQKENLRADPVNFDVFDQEVTGLLVKTSVGASLEGMVVVEGGSQNTGLQSLGSLMVLVYDNSGGSQPQRGFRWSPVSRNGQFRQVGLEAGTFNLGLSNREHTINVTRIERDGVVQPNGVQIRQGEQVTGLRVVFTQGAGIIRGKITVENGPLESGAQLFISLVKTGEGAAGAQPQVDVRGHFIASGLSSGTYEIAAGVYLPTSGRQAMSTKQLVTVSEDGETEVAITLDLNQGRKPTP